MGSLGSLPSSAQHTESGIVSAKGQGDKGIQAGFSLTKRPQYFYSAENGIMLPGLLAKPPAASRPEGSGLGAELCARGEDFAREMR